MVLALGINSSNISSLYLLKLSKEFQISHYTNKINHSDFKIVL